MKSMNNQQRFVKVTIWPDDDTLPCTVQVPVPDEIVAVMPYLEYYIAKLTGKPWNRCIFQEE